MSNNKQSSVEWFAEKLKSQGLLIGEPDNLVAFDQAKAMHQEEIIKANEDASTNELGEFLTGEQYYIEKYGKDNADNSAV